MKRGQFTILVIFGFLAIIAIGIVFLAKSSVQKEQASVSAEEALEDFLKTNKIHNYVESCLQAVSEEAVRLVVFQGGKIWTHQGGSIEMEADGVDGKVSTFGRAYLPVEIHGVIYNTSYVLESTSEAACKALNENSLIPDYPYPRTSLHQLNNLSYLSSLCRADRDSGFFGTRKLNPLCEVYGPNWRGDPGSLLVYSTCEGKYGYMKDKPVQFQIANFTRANLPKCANFEGLTEREGVEIKVEEKPEVQVVFGREDITINATYPITVNVLGRPPLSTHMSFYKRINSDLKETYEFFWDLLLQDAWNSSFSPEKHYTGTRLFKPGLKVEYVSDFCPQCGGTWAPSINDDLLLVKNKNSVVLGEELTIAGIVRNRAPVLDHMQKQMKIDFTSNPETVHELLSEYFDVVAVNSSVINFFPRAVDPDNESVGYNYAGWMGNETSGLSGDNIARCEGALSEFILEVTAPQFPNPETVREKLEDVLVKCEKTPNAYGVNKWHLSNEYVSTNKDASYRIPESAWIDGKPALGVHTVKVMATDGALTDFQNMRILVITTDLLPESVVYD